MSHSPKESPSEGHAETEPPNERCMVNRKNEIKYSYCKVGGGKLVLSLRASFLQRAPRPYTARGNWKSQAVLLSMVLGAARVLSVSNKQDDSDTSGHHG